MVNEQCAIHKLATVKAGESGLALEVERPALKALEIYNVFFLWPISAHFFAFRPRSPAETDPRSACNRSLGANVMGRRVTPFAFISTTLSAFARPRTEAGVRFSRSAIVTEVRPSAASLRRCWSSSGPRLNNAPLHFPFAFSPVLPHTISVA